MSVSVIVGAVSLQAVLDHFVPLPVGTVVHHYESLLLPPAFRLLPRAIHVAVIDDRAPHEEQALFCPVVDPFRLQRFYY